MSMYYAGYYGTVLKLNEVEFLKFTEDYLNSYAAIPEQDEDPDEAKEEMKEEIVNNTRNFEFIYGSDVKNESKRNFQIVPITPDDCDGMIFRPYSLSGDQVFDAENIEELESDSSYLIFSNGQPLKPYGKQPYGSYDDLKNEFMEKISAYLPKEFDWDKHIGLFQYACFA